MENTANGSSAIKSIQDIMRKDVGVDGDAQRMAAREAGLVRGIEGVDEDRHHRRRALHDALVVIAEGVGQAGEARLAALEAAVKGIAVTMPPVNFPVYEGAIRVPMLKQAVDVRGLLPGEIEARVAGALAEEQILAHV